MRRKSIVCYPKESHCFVLSIKTKMMMILGDDDTTMGMFRWAIKVFQGRQYIGRGFMRNSEESKTL